MREESHLDDMRAAIRGDFERLARRRGAQELMQEPVEAPPEPVAEELPEPPVLAVETPPPEHEETEPELEEPAARRGFFARILGL